MLPGSKGLKRGAGFLIPASFLYNNKMSENVFVFLDNTACKSERLVERIFEEIQKKTRKYRFFLLKKEPGLF